MFKLHKCKSYIQLFSQMNIYDVFSTKSPIGAYVHMSRNNFRHTFLSNRWWEWFEIWCAALAPWVVSCMPISLMSDVNFLFTGLELSIYIWKIFVWNYLWEWLEIWYAALRSWVVSCMQILLMSDVNFLFTGLELSIYIRQLKLWNYLWLDIWYAALRS